MKKWFTLADATKQLSGLKEIRYCAFTLAEVLITLGIIGVVAALSLPSMINNSNKKELATAFQKQYSVLSQAVLKVKYEDDLPIDFSNYNYKFHNILAKQYKVLQDCGSINGNTGCILKDIDGKFSYYKNFTGGTLDRSYFDDGGFITADGTTLLFEQGSQSEVTGILVTVDVNGYRKRPNKMGYDLFMFQITKEGKVLPMGAENTHLKNSKETLCSKTSNSNLNGYTCAYYALSDKDYFKNLK